MKAIFTLNTLQEAIKSASLAAKFESPKPILRNVLLTVTDGKFEAVATTMEQTIKTSGETYQTIEAGKVLLTQDAIKRIISTKQNQKITIEGDQRNLTILFESSKASFTTEDYEEFPSCKSEKEKTLIFSLDASQIIEGYTRTEKSTEKDNGRYALGGILLDVMDQDSVSFVSTDGRRMAVQTYETKTAKPGIYILPKAFFAAVKKLFKGHGKIDFYALGDCEVIFQSEKTEYIFPLLEGRFPEWRLGINQLNGKDIKTSRFSVSSLLACDSFAQGITDSYNPGIVFDRASRDSLVLFGRLGTNEAYTTSKGHEIPDNFPLYKMNWYFLLDALKAVPKDAVFDVQSVDSRNGVLMSEKSGFKCLVMPMHIDINPELVEQAKAEIMGNTSAEKPENAPAKKTAKKTAKKAPTLDASTPAADDTTPTEKAHEKREEKPEPEPEPQKEPEPEPEPQKEPEPMPEPLPPAPKKAIILEEEPEQEPAPEKGTAAAWEVGVYTTKKGKKKAAIRFITPPSPAMIAELKAAYFWEYAGTWNGSPRKLPEIFKH